MEKHHQPKKQNAVRRTHVVADVVFVVVIAVVVAVAVFTLTHHQKIQPAVTTRAVRHLRKTLKKVIIKRTHAARQKK